MTDTHGFPFDDHAWDTATDAYLKSDTRALLQQLADDWDDETADYLFFSALLHQCTTYSATFLALPHIIALAGGVSAERRRSISIFLGGVALHAQLPATSGGVSLAAGEPWAETPTGRLAAETFQRMLPAIGQICETSYAEDPSAWHASGMAAARGELELADRLETYDGVSVICPTCGRSAPDDANAPCPHCGWSGAMITP